jgi:hypothetical protein
VLNGFLRFARPDELKLQPTALANVISDVVTTLAPEVERMKVTVKQECPAIAGDQRRPAMLRQALLNLALNGCQAMPEGARCASRAARRHAAGSRWTSRTRASASRPRTSEDLRPLLHDEGTRDRDRPVDWSTESSSCTTARSRSSRRPAAGRDSGSASPWRVASDRPAVAARPSKRDTRRSRAGTSPLETGSAGRARGDRGGVCVRAHESRSARPA